MKRNRKCLLAFATLVALLPALALFAPPAAAQEPAWDASGNVALTSDYVFRGVSQAAEDPAIQAGLKLQHVPSGIYGAAWGSNVDYGDAIGSNAELDLVLGWRHAFGDDLALDLNLTRYTYPGTNDEFDLDYNELIGTLTLRQNYGLQVGWSNAGPSQQRAPRSRGSKGSVFIAPRTPGRSPARPGTGAAAAG